MNLIPDWAPNIHPLLVHFPIALLMTAAGLDIVAWMLRRHRPLRHAATHALFERRDVIIVASISCIYGLGAPVDYGATVLRLKKGASALDVWATDAMLLGTADGIALLADGSVYVNSVGQGTLLRIPAKADGSAGPIVKLETSRPLMTPDGMRSVGSKTMLLVEGAGRLDEVTITGNKAEIKVLKEGLTGPTAVTLVGGMAYVAEAKLNYRNDPKLGDPGPFRAVGVPYKAPK